MQGRSKIAFLLLACALLITVAGAGCGGSDAGNPESKATDYKQALAGAPARLATLYAQGDALIPGGSDAFQKQLEKLRGYPVVVNLWASWCGPCRFEFPYFQQLAAQRGKQVAFLGVDTYDSDDAATTFLEELPLPYPSVTDPDKDVWNDLGVRGLPATAFYDSSGKLTFLHQGQYSSEDDLAADIDKYASG